MVARSAGFADQDQQRQHALQQGKTLKAFVTEAVQRAIEEHQAAEAKRRKGR